MTNFPEQSLTEAAKVALINCNTQSGALPQGTEPLVRLELHNAGLIYSQGMTQKGRAARIRLVDASLGEL